MKILKSSIPGLVEFPARFDKIPTGDGWIEGRRGVDGAEGLWRIDDRLYDLTKFLRAHPGGSEWLTITRGTDITELFESHHLTDKAEKLLPKFYIRDAAKPRAVPLTFDKNGFYKKFKERSINALKNVDFHRPSVKSNLLADSLAIATLLLCLITAATQSQLAVIIAGTIMAFTTIASHNYFHMRDNFRMYYWDMSLMSSREWRITHAMSHHMYPNTIWDFEIFTFEPILQYLPKITAPISRNLSWLYSPIVWFLAFYSQGVRSVTQLPIILKGILTAEDAILGVEHGASAIIVSNHGARQIDGTAATIEVLPEVVKAVDGRIEVYLDGGVRTGTDVFKALALGAKMVFFGRPMIWGLTHDGDKGATAVLQLLKKDIRETLALAGCRSVKEVTREMVAHESVYSRL